MTSYNSVLDVTLNILKMLTLNNKELNEILDSLKDESKLCDSIKYLNGLKNSNSKFIKIYDVLLEIFYQFIAYSKRQRQIFLNIIIVKLLELYFIYIKYYVKDYLENDRFTELLSYLNNNLDSGFDEDELKSKLFDDPIVNYLVYFLIDDEYQFKNMFDILTKGISNMFSEEKKHTKSVSKFDTTDDKEKLTSVLNKYRPYNKTYDKSPKPTEYESDIVGMILGERH